MSETRPMIERLPAKTQSKLRSTQILTSLVQVVSELLQNSLDANATHIDIGVDCREWMCWVRDNGHGFTKDDLETLASARYHSSKNYTPGSSESSSTFGFRGEALASAAEIACLEVFSRVANSRHTWSIIVKGGDVLYKGPAVRWKRESPGTVVCLRDIFYNLPVRRRSHAPSARTLDLIRKEMEAYALMFPHVSFSLEDINSEGDTSQNKDRVIRIPQTNMTLSTFRHLYGHSMTEHIEEINVVNGMMKLEGFISLTGASSKAYQFLFVNRHPIDVSDLTRAIDYEFACGSFAKNALDEDGERYTRSAIRRSPRKAEKKPVYVLNLSIAAEEVDNLMDPSKSTIQLRNKSDVIGFLSSTIRSFLLKHNFLNQNQITVEGSKSPTPSPRKRKRTDLNDSVNAEIESLGHISALSLRNDTRASQAPQSADLFASTNGASQEVIWTDPTTGERFSVDSRTGNSFRCTGGHLQADSQPSDLSGALFEDGRRTLRQRKTNSLVTFEPNPVQSPIPPWIQKALESNRAYPMNEDRIPSVKKPSTSYHPQPGLHAVSQRDNHACHELENINLHEAFNEETFVPTCDALTQHFTRNDLRFAEVVNQVDRKFIACRIPKHKAMQPQGSGDAESQSGSVIVLIDQHAADERIRAERLLKELFLDFLAVQNRNQSDHIGGVRTRELNPPRPVLLTQHEALMIKRSQDTREMLQKWGVRFAELSNVMPNGDGTSDTGSSIGYLQLLVSSIPEVVSDKLLQGDELRDFIKGFLGQIQGGELFTASGLDLPLEAAQDEFLWLKAVRRCPRGLLELINSKACRGAIMFNDSLSMSQCKDLVKQLSETAFPFQCAHGRPSLVPLVETGIFQTKIHKRNIRRNDWMRLETMENA